MLTVVNPVTLTTAVILSISTFVLIILIGQLARYVVIGA